MPQNDSGRDTSLSVGELFENHMSLLKKSVFPKNRGNREMENVWKSRENHLWGFLARPNFCEFLVSEFFNSLTCIPNTRNLSELSRSNIHFQADQLRYFPNKNLSLGNPAYSIRPRRGPRGRAAAKSRAPDLQISEPRTASEHFMAIRNASDAEVLRR
jgi:hypothetical protein